MWWQEFRANKKHLRCMATAATLGISQVLAYLMNGHFPWIGDMTEGFFAFGAAAALSGVLSMLYFIPSLREFSWKDRDLTGYSRPVPEFALSYALAIKEANSHVSFQVLELTKEERVADPFLVARYGDAEAYIAVWDEPKFEGRLSK